MRHMQVFMDPEPNCHYHQVMFSTCMFSDDDVWLISWFFAARRFAILTCMDARLDPSKYAGLSEGDAHVIRNAGGRATDDAIRSLVISYKLLGTQEWFVIHHSDCGMQLFNDQIIAELLEHDLETASIDAHTGKWSPSVPFFSGSSEGKFIKWQTFDNLEVRLFMQ